MPRISKPSSAPCRAHADALEKLERAEAELAKLRQHAEAMAHDLETHGYTPAYASRDAYRADFQEEK